MSANIYPTYKGDQNWYSRLNIYAAPGIINDTDPRTKLTNKHATKQGERCSEIQMLRFCKWKRVTKVVDKWTEEKRKRWN